ncbi:translation initiation factor eIF 4e-like domain-containing protein [Kockovaella imperatae]|uniref:Translation initiation factor eIF 4e-like domain-containing protein n=1 Tax=Kockovaella imperatae TaxID=4999 RepID=A0A1Y1U985_9TREE|nr:translation initiation factor eIF 4e-like domain-containing protein [Kockovaella imperatae]ORX34590.1 translation initiation factor eIF 4e-like domain-containing protein [Kockovaella imperatae]
MTSTAPPPTRRTTSLSGSARLSLSVGRTERSPSGASAERHPLRQEWSISYVHRPPGAKVDYEKEIKRIAKFGSIESFLHLYSHLTPPNELPAVTDLLVFVGRIGRPGVWEEMRDGGKFTLRLAHPVTPLLFETLLFSLLGDQFDDADAVVGCVLSVRQTEDIMSVWVEEEGEGVKSGALREKILSLLSLPPGTNCEYKSNRALLDAASKPHVPAAADGNAHPHHQNHSHSHREGHISRDHSHRERDRERDRPREGDKDRAKEHTPWDGGIPGGHLAGGNGGEFDRERTPSSRHGHGWNQHHHTHNNQWHPPRDRGDRERGEPREGREGGRGPREERDRESFVQKRENGW